MQKQNRCNITTREEGQRLDKILSKYLNKAPKSFVYKMLRKKNITLNDKKADGSEKLNVGDTVTFWLSDETFDKYVLEGGFSGSYLYKNLDEKYKYISDVYKTLIVRDITQRYHIQNIPLLDSISDFLIDNISKLTSYRSLTDTLNSNKNNVSDKTVGTYMKYLCDAYAFYKIRRYDIQGKKYLNTQDKYYLACPSIKYALHGTRNMDYGNVYENIVAMELLRRGYEVYVGVLYNKEIDFVAMRRNEKIYIQVSDNISDDKTFEREVSSLLKIKDAYPKILIARTHHDSYTYEGVLIIDIKNWLVD